MTTAIELRSVSLQMAGRQLLREVNLSLAQGETGVVVGETGSGKSSLVRLVLAFPGAQREDLISIDGEVFVDGAGVFGLSRVQMQELRRKVGVVRGRGGLIENMDVVRNICLPLAYHGSRFGAEDIDRQCAELMASLGIEDLARTGRRPVTLTAAESAYVSLARALIIKPAVLLVDDPTLGLGEQASGLFIDQLFAAPVLTRLVVASRLGPYLNRGDRFFLLEAGKLLELGNKRDVIKSEHPWIKAELANSRWD